MNQYNDISTLQYLGSKARIISHICDPKIKSLYQHSGPEKRRLKSKMSKNRIETYLCDGKARK